MYIMEEESNTSPSLKEKLRETLCLSCCNRTNSRQALESPSSSSSSSNEDKRSLVRASSIWSKTRAHDFPEIKDKCRNIFGRIGGNRHQRRHSSADFSYDPLSYALNFEDGYGDAFLDEAPLKNFSSRLPASPALMPVMEITSSVAVSRKISASS